MAAQVSAHKAPTVGTLRSLSFRDKRDFRTLDLIFYQPSVLARHTRAAMIVLPMCEKAPATRYSGRKCFGGVDTRTELDMP